MVNKQIITTVSIYKFLQKYPQVQDSYQSLKTDKKN